MLNSRVASEFDKDWDQLVTRQDYISITQPQTPAVIDYTDTRSKNTANVIYKVSIIDTRYQFSEL